MPDTLSNSLELLSLSKVPSSPQRKRESSTIHDVSMSPRGPKPQRPEEELPMVIHQTLELITVPTSLTVPKSLTAQKSLEPLFCEENSNTKAENREKCLSPKIPYSSIDKKNEQLVDRNKFRLIKGHLNYLYEYGATKHAFVLRSSFLEGVLKYVDIKDISDVLVYQSFKSSCSVTRKMPDYYKISLNDKKILFCILYTHFIENGKGETPRNEAIELTSQILTQYGIKAGKVLKAYALLADVLRYIGTLFMSQSKVNVAVHHLNPPPDPLNNGKITSHFDEILPHIITNTPGANEMQLNKDLALLNRLETSCFYNSTSKKPKSPNNFTVINFVHMWNCRCEQKYIRNNIARKTGLSCEGLISKEQFMWCIAGTICRNLEQVKLFQDILHPELFAPAVGCALVYPLKSAVYLPKEQLSLPCSIRETLSVCLKSTKELKSWKDCRVWKNILCEVPHEYDYYIRQAKLFFGGPRNTDLLLVNYKDCKRVPKCNCCICCYGTQ